MLLIATLSLSLILPTPVEPPAIVRAAPARAVALPTTALAGLFGGDEGTVYKGGSDSLDLGSLLDSVPADAGGKKGIQRDQQGLERLKERQADEVELAKAKYEATLAAEAAGKDISFAGEVKESASNAGMAAANALFNR